MLKKQLFSLDKIFTVSVLYWCATMFSNVLNWLYNVQLGRTLSKEDFAILTVFLSFQYIISVPANAVSNTIARYTAYYTEKAEQEKYFYFFRQYWWLTIGAGLAAFIFFILFRELIQEFFGFDSSFLTLIFAPILIPLFLLSFEKGGLLGRLALTWVGTLVIVEPLVKFLFLFLGPELHLSPLTSAVVALPISVAASWFVSLLITRSYNPIAVKKAIGRQKDLRDTYGFLGNAFFAGLGTVLLYNVDVLLAKHYLDHSQAGIYSTLSLLGKMLYFGAGSLIPILIPITAKLEAKNQSTKKPFYVLLGLVSFAGFSILSAYMLFPKLIVSLLLTSKGLVALPYLSSYALAMLFFVISACYSSYNLARKNYLPSRMMLFAAVIEGILIFFAHSSIYEIVNSVLITQLMLFIAMVVTQQLKISHISFSENFKSLVEYLRPVSYSKSKQKSILIFNWRDTKHTYGGGAELYLHEIAKRLVKKGYKVTLFTANDGKLAQNEEIDSIQIIRRGGFVTVYLWAAIYLLTKLRSKFDLILDSENGIPFFTPLFTKIPVVLVIHHVHQDVFMRHLTPPLSWIASYLESNVMPVVYKKSTVVTISPSTADAITKQLEMNVAKIIPTGIDTKIYSPGRKEKHEVISYIGRLKEYKGVQYLIQAFAEVKKELPNCTLVIAGDGDYKKNLEKLVLELKLQESVQILGKVSEEKKIALLRRSWLMIQPSYMEGWGITCLEANACGTPVLAANVPGLRDAVKTNTSGFLFTHGSISEIRENLLKILNNKQNLKNLSNTSRKYSENFSWDKQTSEFESLFITLWKTKNNNDKKSLGIKSITGNLKISYE